MGLYVDLALHLDPAAFRDQVAVTTERDADGAHLIAAGMPVEFGEDYVRICTLNGGGWTAREILTEARTALGDALFDGLGPDRIAISMECEVTGETRTFAARLATVPHVTGAELSTHADAKILDRTLFRGTAEPRPVGLSPRAAAWLDAMPEPGARTPGPTEDEADLDAQAEAFLSGMDHAAILKALRDARGRD